MPHFNVAGREEWVCQKGGHVCTGPSVWVERGTPLAAKLDCTGNVCTRCATATNAIFGFARDDDEPVSLREHCRRESGLDGPALDHYIQRHYGPIR